MKKDETDMTIETGYAPIGEILYESFNALGEQGPVIRSLGAPKETGPLRQGEADMPLSDTLSRAVSRLLAAGQLAEMLFPDGRKSTTFIMREGLLDEEAQKLSDPTLPSTTGHSCACRPLSPRLHDVMARTNQIARVTPCPYHTDEIDHANRTQEA
jgi:hypothetical protein